MSESNDDRVKLLVSRLRAGKEAKRKRELPPPQVVHSPDVRRIELPDGLSFRDAAKYCAAKADEQEAKAEFPFAIDGCIPWVGFYAVQRLIERDYSGTFEGGETAVHGAGGRVSVKAKQPPHVLAHPWGAWTIHGLGVLQLRIEVNATETGFNFKLILIAQRFLRPKVEAFFAAVAAEVAKRELYSGAALALVPDPESGQLQTFVPPTLIDVGEQRPDDVILPAELSAQVGAELFLPITDMHALRAAGLPSRRGVLLAGRPGTGKTMSARIAARLALDRGWTVFYLSDARGLESALRLAQAHQPAVLVSEDIDRHLRGERSALTDRILNALDGLDQSSHLVFIATSNDPDSLPAPLLRPGRLDSLILFDAPDAQAALRLVRRYLGSACPQDLSAEVGDACAGLLSASVREVASRSILHARARAADAGMVDCADILLAAHSVWAQQRRLEKAEQPVERSMPTLPIRMLENGNDVKLSRACGIGGLE